MTCSQVSFHQIGECVSWYIIQQLDSGVPGFKQLLSSRRLKVPDHAAICIRPVDLMGPQYLVRPGKAKILSELYTSLYIFSPGSSAVLVHAGKLVQSVSKVLAI